MTNVWLIHLLAYVAVAMIALAVIRTVLYVCLILVVSMILSTVIPHQQAQPQPAVPYEHSD
jgi:hypothetical protein